MDVTNTRGIFSLIDVRIRQNTGNWFPGVKKISNYGFFIRSSNSVRVDFSNDLEGTTLINDFPYKQSTSDAVGNSNYAWISPSQAGPSPNFPTARLEYATNFTKYLTTGALVTSRISLACSGNSNYGWFAGGAGTSAPGAIIYVSSVDRLDYSNDTSVASPRGPLTIAAQVLGGCGSQSYGYFSGGNLPQTAPTLPIVYSRVNRIDYSNDTATASPRGPLTIARGRLSATSDGLYGWFCGGLLPSPITPYTIVDRVDFSNDTATASPRGPMAYAEYVGESGNSSYGWFTGGLFPSNTTPTILPSSKHERIDYSNDTVTPSFRASFGGGTGVSAVENGLPQEIETKLIDVEYFRYDDVPQQILSPTYATNYGYFMAQEGTQISRIDYTNDTDPGKLRSNMNISRRGTSSCSSGSYGYFGGGYLNTPAGFIDSSIIYRLDYYNDKSDTVFKGALGIARGKCSGVSNISYGWFGGGEIQPNNNVSRVDRIDFSNDGATTSSRGPLSSAKVDVSSTGNSSYGWFFGGTSNQSLSSTDRIDYSNDTATALLRGNSSLGPTDRKPAATGNSNYGWFSGGYISPFNTYGTVSIIQRIDYSNDTATTSSRGTLPSSTSYLQGTGNVSYGWISFSSLSRSSLARINYSNDTAIASPRGVLHQYVSFVVGSNYAVEAASAAENGLPQ